MDDSARDLIREILIREILAGGHKLPFNLNKKDKERLARLEAQKQKLERERLMFLRQRAREEGVISHNLEDLKSESGNPFEEEEGQNRDECKRATSKKSEKSTSIFPERAYLCASRYLPPEEEDLNSCGWVKGEPERRKYDNIAPLSGSSGFRFFCKVCGKMIGEVALILS